jgi:hypothetical protein
VLYLFQDTASGELVEAYFPMAEAPALGSVIEHEGRALKRLVSAPQVLVEPDFRHVARSLRARHHTPEHLQKDVPHWEQMPSGIEFPCFHTKGEIIEYESKNPDSFSYDMRAPIRTPAALSQGT